MITLIDGDTVAFRCASSVEPTKGDPHREPTEWAAIARTEELCLRILNTTATHEHRFFISGTDNFRKSLDSSYKAHRPEARPRFLEACREFLVREWGATVSAGCEADDRIGIAAKDNFIIAAIDKDFKQIPGWHFNFVKNEIIEVSPRDAIRNFYRQLLIGDNSDNIKGVRGIGPVKANNILDGLEPEEMEATVRLLPGVLGNEESCEQDSFSVPAGAPAELRHGLLDCPHYTRPAEYRDWKVPEVLLSGNHQQIRQWRRQRALEKTWRRRPDLLAHVALSEEDRNWLEALGA